MKTPWVLGVGMVFGAVLAAVGAFRPSCTSPSDGVVARVNCKAITEQELSLALARLGNNTASSPQQRREVLTYLIDQELLVQRGVTIGLLQSDHTVRKAVAMTVIDNIVASVLTKEPSAEELRTFYDSHQAVFTMPARIHVQHIFITDSDSVEARVRAEQAAAALRRGENFAEIRQRYGNEYPATFPAALVPVTVVQRQLGPTLTDAVLALREGEVSLPVLSATGYHVFRVLAREPEQVLPYDTVKAEVKAEFIRRQRDQELQQQLDRLRAQATIVLSPKDSIVAESVSERPSEEELQTFYEQHHSLFSARTTNAAVTFTDVREQVAEVYLQRARDEALREYLSWLRAEAKVVLGPEMLESENPSHAQLR